MKIILCLFALTAVLASAQAEEKLVGEVASAKAWAAYPEGKITCAAVADQAEGGVLEVKFKKGSWLSRSLHLDKSGRLGWDGKYNGVSFKVKGDGSDGWAELVVGYRWPTCWTYVYGFPLDNRGWREYRIHFADFSPAGANSLLLGEPGALPVSGVNYLTVGNSSETDYNNFRDGREFAFQISDICLISDAGRCFDPKGLKPPLPRVLLEKLKQRESVRIASFGDSITAGNGLAKPDAERYPKLLADMLAKRFDNPNVSARSFAVGGTFLFQTLAWVNRDLVGKPPDIVTLHIGFNDKNGGGHDCEVFRQQLNLWIDRVLAQTKGKSNILLLATIPGLGHAFTALDDYREVVKEVGAARGVMVFSPGEGFQGMGREGYAQYMADFAHPNAAGHQFIAKSIFEYIANLK